ncbi:TlpA family protein disulfide reductase [Massilia glaciei]|uniref:TlpA family protein disulfide reductase n=1 Tax=Massilia glaciei TaxID=1524097 RepID=A0A2U2I6A8_9BURK|nr:TlpA disulfide reductase family protein [Massilia glaciei]PWF55283.1 TlpA family protein disulfide reductase [Massilia glaciei]
MNKKYVLYTLVSLIFIGVGIYAGNRNRPAEAPMDHVAAGHAPAAAAPAAAPKTPVETLFSKSMDDPAGKSQALAQWKGKTLIVNFWAPWCAPCVEEMPELAALGAEHAAKGVQVIGIGIDSSANIKRFADKLKLDFPLYVAGLEGTDLSRAFGNTAGGLPYTVLIGADGEVKKTYLGRIKFDQLKADLAAL